MRLFYLLQYGTINMLTVPYFLIFIDLVFPLLQIVVCPLKFVCPKGAFPVADLHNLQHCENYFLQWQFWGSLQQTFYSTCLTVFCDISFRYCGLCCYFCTYRPWQGNICSCKGQFLCRFAEPYTTAKIIFFNDNFGKVTAGCFYGSCLTVFSYGWATSCCVNLCFVGKSNNQLSEEFCCC